ncbi:hypothetical protein LEP1GSC047_4246 [Leptospira inadai serovar Lyme str. 10]|uniref:Uncharacterized protein n=1 Tax=Leptospira inadai serovar Lyme str. 10 TaxID=1049790 RepID=V6HKW1_9LEPT|nr:hypothetical protein [Leptospira inadai]EQA37540.1 hypothetical protein LEP1GSC047_4246 [Leptospira inadai serovar Lyme str. 10]
MKKFILLISLWILWFYAARGTVQLGSYNSAQECKAAIDSDKSGLLLWRTRCLETK